MGIILIKMMDNSAAGGQLMSAVRSQPVQSPPPPYPHPQTPGTPPASAPSCSSELPADPMEEDDGECSN